MQNLVWDLKKTRCRYKNFKLKIWKLKKCEGRLWPGSDWLRVLSLERNTTNLVKPPDAYNKEYFATD
jgi:hypothetical protein